jgi:hypothetical protein
VAPREPLAPMLGEGVFCCPKEEQP